ncbi:MAG: hypothetical protein ACWA5U_00810 [bacterium]
MKKTVTYIIGVHGIGEQRKNENILPIINGFARVRQTQRDNGQQHHNKKLSDKVSNGACPLTQGILSSQQSKTPWIEFENIPSQPPKPKNNNKQNEIINDKTETRYEDKTLRFMGHTVDECDLGKNFRFVDLHWADIMQSHLDIAGQEVETWTQALIDRLKLRDLDKDEQYGWIPQLLISMRNSILPIKWLLEAKQRLLTSTQNHFSDTVFNRFLGDAQLYGEYRTTRDQAIFRFHRTLAEVHHAHCEEQANNPHLGNPRYIVLGHSLGSIMSFDALLYAHGANKPNQEDPSQIHLDLTKLDLSMYCDLKDKGQGENLPDLSWISYVDTFISLGSPIDKYLILWWTNYKHLIDTSWLDTNLKHCRETQKIKHYNYCDEQDPVGHELDTAYTANVVKSLFEKEEDIVFMRYGMPGVAHIKYWDDVPLLQHIVQTAIDQDSDYTAAKTNTIMDRAKVLSTQPKQTHISETGEINLDTTKTENTTVEWFKPMAYARTLFWSYAAIPSLGLLFASLFFMLGYYNIVQHEYYVSGVLAFITSLVIFFIMLRGMVLMVKWRQLMRETRKMRHDKEKGKNPRKKTLTEERMEQIAKFIIYVTPCIWLSLVLVYHHYFILDSFWTIYLYVLVIGATILSTLNMACFIHMKWYLSPDQLIPDVLDAVIMKYSERFPQLKYLVGIKKRQVLTQYMPDFVAQKKYSLNFHDYICCKDQTRSLDKKPKGCGKCQGNANPDQTIEKSTLLK